MSKPAREQLEGTYQELLRAREEMPEGSPWARASDQALLDMEADLASRREG